MFKKAQYMILKNCALMFAFIAGLGFGTNSMFIMYEPDMPEQLKSRD